MAQNNYITTGKGFIKDIINEFDEENKTFRKIIEFTPHLRYAKKFTSKTAKKLIENNEFEAFIYNPWQEEPVGTRFRIAKYHDHAHYKVEKIHRAYETDRNFLTNGQLAREKEMTFEEAKKLAVEKNNELIRILQEQNEKVGNSISTYGLY